MACHGIVTSARNAVGHCEGSVPPSGRDFGKYAGGLSEPLSENRKPGSQYCA